MACQFWSIFSDFTPQLILTVFFPFCPSIGRAIGVAFLLAKFSPTKFKLDSMGEINDNYKAG